MLHVEKQPAVYILASKKNGTLYIGVTGDLSSRILQHRSHAADGFTKKYNVTNLVYYERYIEMMDAIHREKQLKEWKRAWKIELIEKMNPNWDDLWPDIVV